MVMHFENIVLTFYIKKVLIFLDIICMSKRKINFDKSKSFLINNIPIVLLVINHIEILLLFNKTDIIKNFYIT